MAQQQTNFSWTPYETISYSEASRDTKVFAILVAAGLSLAESYRYAFKSTAKTASLAVMASRRLQDNDVRSLLTTIQHCYDSDWLVLRKDLRDKI
jgi:hypothetical protein